MILGQNSQYNSLYAQFSNNEVFPTETKNALTTKEKIWQTLKII